MVQIELNLSPGIPPSAIAAVVDRYLAEAGLVVTLRDTLRAYPGSTHWHAKRAGERGVLEVTSWPAQRRLWLSVHHNRAAPWIEALLPELRQQLEAALASG